VFFRGYLLQATGRLTRNVWMLSVINGVVFTLPHLANPETEGNAVLAGLNWFVFGFFATIITLRSGSLDYALGIHAVNNLFGLIIAGYEGGRCQRWHCSSLPNWMQRMRFFRCWSLR